MAKNNLGSPDEALAGMAKVGAPRQPMGNAAYSSVNNASGAPSKNTKTVAKKGSAKADPVAVENSKGYRSRNVAQSMGARYAITATMGKQMSPEAGYTQANGRIVPPAVMRTNANFAAGQSDFA